MGSGSRWERVCCSSVPEMGNSNAGSRTQPHSWRVHLLVLAGVSAIKPYLLSSYSATMCVPTKFSFLAIPTLACKAHQWMPVHTADTKENDVAAVNPQLDPDSSSGSGSAQPSEISCRNPFARSGCPTLATPPQLFVRSLAVVPRLRAETRFWHNRAQSTTSSLRSGSHKHKSILADLAAIWRGSAKEDSHHLWLCEARSLFSTRARRGSKAVKNIWMRTFPRHACHGIAS